ncbi:MAG: diphosphomevalonate decarboxylase [Pseudomonadales bacterium]|nr:diphosphomevalonate decarboxylase [Pseudomonadales bacterium]NRA17664.1 diphosphomevalonate decarboxylase [Oceanospirillaceae bacterium]
MSNNSINKASVVNRYLQDRLEPKDYADAFAPSNIALCKYWGKRDGELNLPVNSSLSVSLAHLGSHTKISRSEDGSDKVRLNNKDLPSDSDFSRKVIDFVDLFRRGQKIPLIVDTRNNIPTAAGLASSASGFAALMLALDDFFSLNLDKSVLSAFARMGSGSASRSIYTGFVRWDMGSRADGMDSVASQLDNRWPDLCIGLIKVSSARKPVDSRSGMQRTIETSKLYPSWPEQAGSDLITLEQAIDEQNFAQMGACAEKNAMSMHATMMSAWPPLVYWLPESLAVMQQVWQLREAGVAVYFTMDAGPNLKLLFETASLSVLQTEFPIMEVIQPFSD